MKYVLIFFIHLLVAAWVYSDAKERKSRSPALWAFWVLMIMIVFLPLYLIMRPVRPNNGYPPIIQNVGDEQHLLCPSCQRYIKLPARYCPHCGQRI